LKAVHHLLKQIFGINNLSGEQKILAQGILLNNYIYAVNVYQFAYLLNKIQNVEVSDTRGVAMKCKS
jgi:hypothetical protein